MRQHLLQPSDLVRIAELIKMGADTARAFSNTTANGECSRITAAAKRIEAAAEELAEVGREMEGKAMKAD